MHKRSIRHVTVALTVGFSLAAGALPGHAQGQGQNATAQASAAPPGNAQNGRKLFAANGCYQCHGYEAQGSSTTGPRLGPRPIAFAQFSRYVRAPTGQMPPYTAKVMPDGDLADVYAFLSALP